MASVADSPLDRKVSLFPITWSFALVAVRQELLLTSISCM
jgi:hypothetical protein